MSLHYAGIYPILYAFFKTYGDLDRGAMRLQVKRCLTARAHGIAVLRLIARRLGISAVPSRGPDLGPTPFGLAEIECFYAQLGPL